MTNEQILRASEDQQRIEDNAISCVDSCYRSSRHSIASGFDADCKPIDDVTFASPSRCLVATIAILRESKAA